MNYGPARLRELLHSEDPDHRAQGVELWHAVGMPDVWDGGFLVQVHGSVLRIGRRAGDVDVMFGNTSRNLFQQGLRVPDDVARILAAALTRRWVKQRGLPDQLPLDLKYGVRVPAYRPLTPKDRVILLGTSPSNWFRRYKTATSLMRWAGESGDEGTLLSAAQKATRIYPGGVDRPGVITPYCGEGFRSYRSAWAKLSRGQQERFLGYLEEAHGSWWAEFFQWAVPGEGTPSYYMTEAAAIQPSRYSNHAPWFGPECEHQEGGCPSIYDIFTVP